LQRQSLKTQAAVADDVPTHDGAVGTGPAASREASWWRGAAGCGTDASSAGSVCLRITAAFQCAGPALRRGTGSTASKPHRVSFERSVS